MPIQERFPIKLAATFWNSTYEKRFEDETSLFVKASDLLVIINLGEDSPPLERYMTYEFHQVLRLDAMSSYDPDRADERLFFDWICPDIVPHDLCNSFGQTGKVELSPIQRLDFGFKSNQDYAFQLKVTSPVQMKESVDWIAFVRFNEFDPARTSGIDCVQLDVSPNYSFDRISAEDYHFWGKFYETCVFEQQEKLYLYLPPALSNDSKPLTVPAD